MKLGKKLKKRDKKRKMTKAKLILNFFIATTCLLAVSCSEVNPSSQDLREAKLTVEKNDDGRLKRIGYLIGDKKTGEWKSFVRDRLSSVVSYQNGLKEGKATWFNLCSGKIIEEGQNKEGQPIGLWYRYIDGELVAVKEYSNGTPEIVYHNPKYKNAGEVPPPPPSHGYVDCEEFIDN